MADIKQLHSRANQLYQKGRLHDAKKAFEKILKRAPHSVGSLNLYGITLAQLGDASAAANQFSKIIKIEPKNPGAYDNLARVYMQLQQYSQVQTLYEQALKLAPDSYNLHFGLAGALMSQSNFNLALESFNKAKAINATDLSLFINIGTAYSQLGQYDDAIKAFQQALSLDPNSAEAYLRLGQLYIHNNNFLLAEETLYKAYQIKDDNFNIHLSLADAYQYNSKNALALKHYYAADKLAPESQNIYTKLDKLILHNGSDEKKVIIDKLSEGHVYKNWSVAIDDAKKLVELTEYYDYGAMAALHKFFDAYRPDLLHSRDWWQQQLNLFGDAKLGHDKILRGIHSAVFSWSLPDKETLTIIAEFVKGTRLYSYGAGSALWERLLFENFGVEVVATDFKPRHSYLPIITEDYSQSIIPEKDTIFLSWIIRGDTGVLNILNQMKPGQKLILVGEPRDEHGIPRICSAPEMFDLLDKDFSLSKSISLVSYSMLNDTVSLYIKN